ncbi:MAG: hypothetical protein ACXVH6_05195, partial [Halobacteriota archaeon]
ELAVSQTTICLTKSLSPLSGSAAKLTEKDYFQRPGYAKEIAVLFHLLLYLLSGTASETRLKFGVKGKPSLVF